MTERVAEGLASFVASLSTSAVPADVRAAVKRHLLDSIGVALAAAGTNSASAIVAAVKAWGGTREAGVIGTDAIVPAPAAALANGALIRSLGFDDAHVESAVDASATVVPAALAVGQEAGANGAEIITACAIGYEIAARIGAAAPGRFHARGLDATGIAGSFAAASVAGRLWNLSVAEIAAALGIAGSQAAGLFVAARGGTEPLALHAGWAAHSGVIAADLARRGVRGPRGVLDRKDGFFAVYLAGETVDVGRLTRGLGYDWETKRLAIKPYPASHFLHAYMDAARDARVRAGDIERVICTVPRGLVEIACEPREAKASPGTAQAARLSLPYAIAVALVGGRDGLEMFADEARTDSRVLSLAARIRYVVDDTLRFPSYYGARLMIIRRDGREITTEQPLARGHPDLPLSDDEVRAKFLANALRRLDQAAAEKLLAKIAALDTAESIAEIMALGQGA